jgi:hypothetical protein
MKSMHRLSIVLFAWALSSHAPAEASAGYETYSRYGTVAPATDSSFAGLIARLSEEGGFFDSDNLVSNEATYLHVMGAMRAMGVRRGAYIGVGPEQNFSYIAQVRPSIAYLIDIRRDNLLQHLWFKAMFALAKDRAEYLAIMLGRSLPDDSWRKRPLEEVLAYLDTVPPDPEYVSRNTQKIAEKVISFGVPLTDVELAAIESIHQAFIQSGLELRFTSHNRPARYFYPTLRDLITERDLSGRQVNYLMREEDFAFVKQLHARDRIIPVTGDLAGPHALRAIGRDIAARGERVSAFYVSNVEFYLMRQGSFDRFAENAATLPRGPRSVIIRSLFGGLYRIDHPQSVPGYFSTQLLQTLESFVAEHQAGGYLTYRDVVTKHAIDLR